MRSCSRTFPSSDYAPTELAVWPWRKGRRLTAHLLRIAGWLVCSTLSERHRFTSLAVAATTMAS